MDMEKYRRRSEVANYINKELTPKRNLKWYFKQLLPHTNWAVYIAPEGRRLAVWRSWFGRHKILIDTKIPH